MPVLIRPRRPSDLDGCVAALAAVHAADRYPLAWPADPVRWLIGSERTLAAWVADDGAKVVGHVVLGDGSAESALAAAVGLPPQRIGVVLRLFVVPFARGEGLGERLLDAAAREASARALRLCLEVIERSGAAIALYQRLGWQHVGTGIADWTAPDGGHEVLHYFAAPSSAG
jgi:[ribosomal protein S18]-alanine N-acetyltransferase